MRRSRLARRKGLSRTSSASLSRTPLATGPKPRHPVSDARTAWASTGAGFCEACDEFADRLDGHHVTTAEVIRRAGRLDMLWDLRNRMLVCRRCHSQHTSAFRRLPVERIPDEALEFACDFFGSDARAADYIARYYRRARA